MMGSILSFAIGEGGRSEDCGWWAAYEDPLTTSERLRQWAAIQDGYPLGA